MNTNLKAALLTLLLVICIIMFLFLAFYAPLVVMTICAIVSIGCFFSAIKMEIKKRGV